MKSWIKGVLIGLAISAIILFLMSSFFIYLFYNSLTFENGSIMEKCKEITGCSMEGCIICSFYVLGFAILIFLIILILGPLIGSLVGKKIDK